MMSTATTWFRRGGRPQREGTLAAVIVALSTIFLVALAANASIYTIDSYVYLAKARSLVAGHGLSVPWNDGVDRKFFEGYSIALALPVGLFGDRGFIVLAALVQILLGATFVSFLRRVEERASVRVLALGLLLLNPLLLWWSSVPASEPLFTLLVLAAIHRALVFRLELGAPRTPTVLGAAALAGFAMATRAEGALVAPILLLIAGPRLWRERRARLALCCVVLTLAPEAMHVAYLSSHALATRSASAYVDELRGHAEEIEIVPAAWENLRAPFWTIFRFDTEREVYAKYFAPWLIAAQTTIVYVYLASIALTLLSGIRRRSIPFACAVAVCGYAAIHAFWYYRYERFMTVVTPFAALILAWSLAAFLRLLLRAAPRLQRLAFSGLGAASAITCGVYGMRVSEMHAARLAEREQGRNYRAIAAQIDRADPATRAIVTDFGPYLAYYTRRRHAFLDGETDFYADAVPWCERGRAFLVQHDVGLLASRESAATIADRLDLERADYDVVAGGPTLLALHVVSHAMPDFTDHASPSFSPAPTFGGKIALDRAELTSVRTSRCGTVEVTASARLLGPLTAGDELFVHVDDIDDPRQRLDVGHGVITELPSTETGTRRFQETFIAQIPPGSTSRRVEIWIGLWNSYSGTRGRLESAAGKRNDDRWLAGELPVSLH